MTRVFLRGCTRFAGNDDRRHPILPAWVSPGASVATGAVRRWRLAPISAVLCAVIGCARSPAPPVGDLEARYQRHAEGFADQSLIFSVSLHCNGKGCFLITEAFDRCRANQLRFRNMTETMFQSLRIQTRYEGKRGVIVAEEKPREYLIRYRFEFTITRKPGEKAPRFDKLISLDGSGKTHHPIGREPREWKLAPVDEGGPWDEPCGNPI